MNLDEGYTDDSDFDHAGVVMGNRAIFGSGLDQHEVFAGLDTAQGREELAYKLLSSLPRSRLATIQRKLAPLLQFDIVGALPAEISLQIFTYLPCPTLLACGLVSRRWHSLANDQTLWKRLCRSRGWSWRPRHHISSPLHSRASEVQQDSDDEGMGDSDEEGDEEEVAEALVLSGIEAAKAELTLMHAELDSGFASMSFERAPLFNEFLRSKSTSSATNRYSSFQLITSRPTVTTHSKGKAPMTRRTRTMSQRNSAPTVSLHSLHPVAPLKPNYKLLYLTHIRIQRRIFTSSYRPSTLQTRDGTTALGHPVNSHTNTIYCLQLYTYATTDKQVLFTGSRDKTIREWNIATGCVERVFGGVHTSSVLSVCAANGLLASAGSDRKVVVWDLGDREDCDGMQFTPSGRRSAAVVKVIEDHEDSVLCVRFDFERLVSCSKDRTVRTYVFPSLEPQFVLRAHRAAVNAVSISSTLIVSGSGDRSMRLWDAKTGVLLRTFENHHSRGIASIDFKPPFVLSGSSDKHLRLLDISTLQGWCTFPDAYQHGHHHHQSIHNATTAGVNTSNPNANAPPFYTQPFFTDDEDDLLPFTLPHSSISNHSFVACQVCGSTSTVPVYGGTSHAIDDHCYHGFSTDLAGFNVYSGGQGYGGHTHNATASGSTSGRNFSTVANNAGPLMMVGPGGRRFLPGFGGMRVGGGATAANGYAMHSDLVRSVAFGGDFVLSGSYDLSIKVWDRKTGALVADLTGGHTGRIFSIGFDGTKIVSCGEDQKICIWDFSHGIDTSFIQS
ncbi:WD40 repeat-like protein [Marasmius fiardii PR-910]|nr:WD40 repeat-like protein [Marasmius fiardii PR-910]